MNNKSIYGLLLVCGLVACGGSDQKTTPKDKANYEQGKISMEEVEKKDPLQFLKVNGKDKKNLLGQTVIKGTITNNAKIVAYKDVEIKLMFYSKTGTLLEEDRETIYENIPPGGSADFKSKYFAPKGSDSVEMQVVGATPGNE